MSTVEEIARNLRDAANVVESLGLGRSRLICVSCDTYDKGEFLVEPWTFREVCESLVSISTHKDESIHATGYLVSGHERYEVSTVVRERDDHRDYFEDLLEESQCQS